MKKYDYDPDRFDAEIVIDRSGYGRYTADILAELAGLRTYKAVFLAMNDGRIPPPAFPSWQYHTPHEWSREQAVAILARVFANRRTKADPRFTFPHLDADLD